jgi:DNA primase
MMTTSGRVDFAALKTQADFRKVLAHYGLRPVGQGDQLKLLCPFHDEGKPSCSINVAEGIFHCFGCAASGNVLEFVQRMETLDGAAVSIREAGIRLAAICGLPIGEAQARPGRQVRRRDAVRPEAALASPVAAAARPGKAGGGREGPGRTTAQPVANKPLSGAFIERFQANLDSAHPYLETRGLDRRVIQEFGLGVAAAGSMAQRLCIGIHNPAGELVAYAGRWAGAESSLPAGEDKYKLPKGFMKSLELFNLHRVRDATSLVVVEGYFGAMRLHGLGIAAVALMGSAIAPEQLQRLRQHCPRLIYVTVLMDGDAAGREAEAKVVSPLARQFWVWAARLPDGQQPDTLPLQELRSLLA